MGKIFVDEQGIAAPKRPMTLQENYGRMPKMPAGQISYTGGARPVGPPSGLSRPGIATGAPQATQTPVNPRRLPVPRSQSAPVASRPVSPPATNLARSFTLGPEGATVSPVRPTRPIAQIAHTPSEPLENIDAEVRARINSGSRRFVGPQQPEVMPIATPGKTITFGGRGGAQPVLPGGGIAGALYRNWSQKTGRYIPGLEQAWGGKPTTYREIAGFARGEMQRQNTPTAGQEIRIPLPPRAAARPIAGTTAPVADAPLHNENRTGQIPPPVKMRTVPAPAAAPDGGSGYAMVGGKRINYQDIGTKRDPLAQRRDGFVSTPEGGTMMLGNPSAYRPASRDERPARGIADLTPQETIARNHERIQSDLATITANMGNQYDGEQQIAAAKMRIAALQGQNDLLQKGIAGDQALEGHKYAADAGLTGNKYAADAGVAAHRIAGNSQVEAARLGAEATSNTALAKLLRDQQERQEKAQQDAAAQQRKDIHDVLTNGYGVAPTPQAIRSYLAHQKKLDAWDSNVTKWLAAHAKANPDQAAAVKDALVAYHRNPKDPAAIESVRAARNLLTGGGRGVMPQWFEDALRMPVFTTTGLQAWKQPQLSPEGV